MPAYQQGVLREELGERLHFYEQLASTNDEALRLAQTGSPDGVIVLAERQTAGRGRRGAGWFAGEGSGIAVTLLFRPTIPRALWSRLSLVAGLAVAKVLERRHVLAEIKWPNDVLVADRKVCGILVEAEGDAVVIGIGLNVGQMELPTELAESATSLAMVCGEDLSREEILVELVAEFDALLSQAGRGFGEILESIRERCWLTGKQIQYLAGGEQQSGRCEGIGAGGELLVAEQGETHKVLAAELIRVI